jgi:hypothetical protein
MAQSKTDPDDQVYEEREAVAIFGDEASLDQAVAELLAMGFTRDDISLLAASEKLTKPGATAELADQDEVAHGAFVSPEARREGLAAIVGAPAYLAGVGAAAVVATGGAALIPAIAVVAGSGLAGGALGLILARIVGRHHAERVAAEIAGGGLLLWVRLADSEHDGPVLAILQRNGGQCVHVHVVRRSWGITDVPFHDAEPDPFLDRDTHRATGDH